VALISRTARRAQRVTWTSCTKVATHEAEDVQTLPRKHHEDGVSWSLLGDWMSHVESTSPREIVSRVSDHRRKSTFPLASNARSGPGSRAFRGVACQRYYPDQRCQIVVCFAIRIIGRFSL